MRNEHHDSLKVDKAAVNTTEVIGVIALELIRPVSLNEKLNNILFLINKHFGLDHTMILLPEGDLLTVFASRGYSNSGIGATVKFGEGLIGAAAERGKKIKLNNLSWKIQYFKAAVGVESSILALPGLPGAESQIVIPLIADERLIAVLSAESLALDILTSGEEDFLMQISQLIGMSIQNTLVIDRLEKTVTERTFKLQKQKELLERSNESKDRLFSIIVHDLKSPVSSLKQVSEIMEHYLGENDVSGVVSTGERVVKSIKELSTTLDSLLAWSLTQAGVINFEMKEFNCERLIKSVVKSYKSSWEQKNIQFKFLSDNHNKAVLSDQKAVQSIITNFLHNAVKFSHHNGEIRISMNIHSNHLEIVIQDQGIGMNKAQLKNFFLGNTVNPSTKGTANEPGTGLGVATSIWLAHQLNIIIDIKSVLKTGTTVLVQIPLK